LLILLGGIKDLAALRGIRSVDYVVTASPDSSVTSVCKISFFPNFETEGVPVSFSAIGDATALNTNGFGRQFLGPIAENRSFVRCIRNFLRINIVSQEELPQNKNASPADDTDKASELLEDVMAQHGVTFEKILDTLQKDKFEGAGEIKSVSDIPKFKQFELIDRIKKAVSSIKKK
jgi:hypothetical protein